MKKVSKLSNDEISKLQREMIQTIKDDFVQNTLNINKDLYNVYVSITTDFTCINIHMKNQSILYAFDIIVRDNEGKVYVKKTSTFEFGDKNYIALLETYISCLNILSEDQDHYITVLNAARNFYNNCESKKHTHE